MASKSAKTASHHSKNSLEPTLLKKKGHQNQQKRLLNNFSGLTLGKRILNS